MEMLYQFLTFLSSILIFLGNYYKIMYRALFFLLGESLDILSEDINLVSKMSPTDRDTGVFIFCRKLLSNNDNRHFAY